MSFTRPPYIPVGIEGVIAQIDAYEKKRAEEPMRTIREWDEIYQIVVYDPDGFDRTDPYLFRRLFTEEEYLEGAKRSTCQFNRDGLFFKKFILPHLNEGIKGE